MLYVDVFSGCIRVRFVEVACVNECCMIQYFENQHLVICIYSCGAVITTSNNQNLTMFIHVNKIQCVGSSITFLH